MTSSVARQHCVLAVAVLLTLSIAVGTVGAVGPTGASGSAGTPAEIGLEAVTPPDSKPVGSATTVNLTANVSVWERAGLPFRIDTADAAKSTLNGAISVEYEPENTGQIDARREAFAVYQPGTVNATFESVTGAGTSEFAGEDAQVVVARLNASGDATDGIGSPPASFNTLGSLIDPNADGPDATFTVADSGTVDGDGSLDTTVTFAKPGTYAVFLATGDAFDASDGTLSTDGNATVVGVDTAVVERDAAAVTDYTTAVEPGENATVTVETPSDGANVSVALYHTRMWVNSRTVTTVTEPVGSADGAPETTIGHSIAEVNGVTRVDGPVSVMGTRYGDGRISGSVTASEVVDLLVNGDDESQGAPNTTVIGDGTALDGSVVAERNVSGTTTVEVPTLGNWSEGRYTWALTAQGPNATGVQTAIGELTVEDAGDGSSTWRYLPELQNAAVGSTVKRTPSAVNVTLAGTTPGEPVRLSIPVSDAELSETGYVVTGASLNFTADATGEFSIATADDPSVSPVDETGDLGYFRVRHSLPNETVSNATYSVLVSDRYLDRAGVEPEDVALFRLEQNGWNELPTRQVDETTRGYHFRADSPGLSVYAIGERGAARPEFNITSAEINRSEVPTGGSIAVNATVANLGSGPGMYNGTLSIGNRSVENRTVRIAADDRAAVTFTYQIDAAPDTYSVTIGNVTIGAITVRSAASESSEETSQSESSTESPDETSQSDDETSSEESTAETPPTEEAAGFDIGSVRFILLVGTVAVAVGGLVFYRRRER